jgi:hypothetical protein
MRPLPSKGETPQTIPQGPNTPGMKPGMRPLPSKGVGLGRIRALPKDAPVEPSGGMMRTADMQDSNNDGTDDRDQRPSAQPQKKEIKQDLRGLKNQKREMKAVGQKPKPKFLSKFRSQRDTGRNVNTRAGLRNTRGLREDVVDSVFEKLRLVQAAPATDYIEEKMNMKTAEMGEVIKDFEKSDAPQFKGKSKAKRRQMAIAAKLQAERG